MAASKLTLRCPDCQSHLVIDSETGEVLFHKPAKEPSGAEKDFDQLLQKIDDDKSQAEEVFDREVSALKSRENLLEKKFEEALRNAKESPEDEPPPRPWDLD